MDYNPNTPAARGQEERYTFAYEAPMLNPGYAVQLRTRPGAVTPSAAHLLLPTVRGAPGMGLALVNAQQPPVTVSDFFPGTDTGALVSNFQDQGGAAVNFSDVNDPVDDTDYARTSVAYSSNNGGQLYFRGNNAGALAGRRILQVQIMALIQNRRTVSGVRSGNSVNTPVIGAVLMGANVHYGQWAYVHKVNAFTQVELASWFLSPNTTIPWTVTEVDNIISAANADKFGLDLYGKSDNQGQYVSAFWLRVTHCAENRIGFYYKRGQVPLGWNRYPQSGFLTTPGGGGLPALSANTWYWWEINALNGSLGDYFTLSAVVPTVDPATDPTDNTSDHRQSSLVFTTGPGGAGQAGDDRIFTSKVQGAVLLETSGPTINPDSQPYGSVSDDFVGIYLGTTYRFGQQITTDSSVPGGGYGGITLAVGWWDPTQMPTRPLFFEVRSGAGAINAGGGVLEATATLIPMFTSPDVADTFVKFDGGNWTPAINTQYHVHYFSDAVAMDGQNAWRVPADDTASNLVLSGSATTVANVEGASQGGQTDSYFTGGVAIDRWDTPLAFTAPPAGPAAPTIVGFDHLVDENGVDLLPPRLQFTWPTTALGANFGGYHVWMQQRTVPTRPPWLLATLNADAFNGLTPAQAEAQLREFWCYEFGWLLAGGQYAEGWRLGVSVVHGGNGMESPISYVDWTTATNGQSLSWLASNAAPYLNAPLFVITRESPSQPYDHMTVFEELGDRDHSVVHVPGTVPGRKFQLKWASDAEFPDESILAGPRAAYVAGRQQALLRCRGDLAWGQCGPISTTVEAVQLAAAADFVTTSQPDGTQPALAGPNMPAGFVLNGSTQYVTHANNALLNPGSSPFSFFLAGKFPAPANNKTAMSKGDIGSFNGYGIFSDATQWWAFANANTVKITGTGSALAAGALSDGQYHVVVVTVSGTTVKVYVDDALVNTSTATVGTVSNSTALTIGANNGGASQQTALAPANSWGVYLSALSAAQALALSRYLRGCAGQRAPYGAAPFVDCRDDRSFGKAGKLTDLSGNALDGTVVASPLLRGSPWDLALLERQH